jgi:hypothetical protein
MGTLGSANAAASTTVAPAIIPKGQIIGPGVLIPGNIRLRNKYTTGVTAHSPVEVAGRPSTFTR